MATSLGNCRGRAAGRWCCAGSVEVGVVILPSVCKELGVVSILEMKFGNFYLVQSTTSKIFEWLIFSRSSHLFWVIHRVAPCGACGRVDISAAIENANRQKSKGHPDMGNVRIAPELVQTHDDNGHPTYL